MNLPVDRVIWSVILLAGFVALGRTFVGGQKNRQIGKQFGKLLEVTSRTPTLLYFWSDGCAQCTPQENQIQRALGEVEAKGGQLSLVKYNALQETELVRGLNILTVPTTILLDREGNIAAWNPGLTAAGPLIAQMNGVLHTGVS
ncbi:MAG: thioredoxin family protein [Deltaproteobacteria bacterium]